MNNSSGSNSIPITRIKVQSSPEKSKYTFSKRKNPPPNEFKSYPDVIMTLTHTYKMSFTDAESMLKAFWERAFNKEEPGVVLAELNAETREIFKFFKWHRASNGNIVTYVKTSTTCEEYVYSEDLIGTSHIIYFNATDKKTGKARKISLFEWMNSRYAKALNENTLFKRPIKKDVVSAEDDEQDTVVEYMTLSDYWTKMVQMYWEQDVHFKFMDLPVEISTDPKQPCFYYFDESKIVEGECPTWDDWQLKIPEPLRPVFRAWIYSIFDPENHGRQLLWLSDRGFSGKSSIINAIAKYMNGKGHASISRDSMSDKFGYAALYGKRFVTYGDVKNTRLIQTEKIHSLLGGDIVQIENKHEKPFSARVHARVMVAANVPPEINSHQRNEVTRIIYIPMDEDPAHVMKRYAMTDENGEIIRDRMGHPITIGNKDFDKELLAQMNHFLFKCREDYKKLCPTGQDIILQDGLKMWMFDHCVSVEQMKHEEFCNLVLEFNSAYWMRVSDLLTQMDSEGFSTSHNSFDFANISSYLEKAMNCVKKRRNAEDRDTVDLAVPIITGVRIKNSPIKNIIYCRDASSKPIYTTENKVADMEYAERQAMDKIMSNFLITGNEEDFIQTVRVRRIIKENIAETMDVDAVFNELMYLNGGGVYEDLKTLNGHTTKICRGIKNIKEKVDLRL